MTSVSGPTTQVLHQLRPGVPVMARSPGILQVGLVDRAARVPDVAEVRRLLTGLTRSGGAPAPAGQEPAASEAFHRLVDAGLAVSVPPGPPDPSMTALLAQSGPDAVRRHAARATSPIAVEAPAGLKAVVKALLDQAGLCIASDAQEPAAHLIMVGGAIDRDRLDPFVRSSTPHLVVAGDAAGVRVGPFVSPGVTACLRCVDAHESLRDERLPLLLAQAAEQTRHRPGPRDPVLDQLALSWAVRDLARFVEGDQPSTWSTTVDVGPTGTPTVTAWGRHPYCGCAWDGFLDLP